VRIGAIRQQNTIRATALQLEIKLLEIKLLEIKLLEFDGLEDVVCPGGISNPAKRRKAAQGGARRNASSGWVSKSL
jgi:hypothetical protein